MRHDKHVPEDGAVAEVCFMPFQRSADAEHTSSAALE